MNWLAFAIPAYLEARAEVGCPHLASQRNLSRRFLSLNQEGPAAYRRDHLPGHFTGSALILTIDRSQVLLTHHRKLNRWLQLGGHSDGEENLLDVALREGREESGLSDLRADSGGLIDLDIHLIPARAGEPEHYHYDARFFLTTESPERVVVSEESNELQWFTLDEARALTSEPSLNRLFEKLSAPPT